MKRYDSDDISAPGLREGEYVRADLEFYGVDHSGASFEARIFINNTDATKDTPRDIEHGYVGAFHIFGHGGCLGDVGHCDVPDAPLHPFDRRPAHQLLPHKKTVIVTEGLKQAVAAAKRSKISVSVVPVVRSVIGNLEKEDVLHFDRLALVTYD